MEKSFKNQFPLRLALFSLLLIFILASALSFKNTVAQKEKSGNTNVEIVKNSNYVFPNFIPVTQIGY